jgi:hypothetical protein
MCTLGTELQSSDAGTGVWGRRFKIHASFAVWAAFDPAPPERWGRERWGRSFKFIHANFDVWGRRFKSDVWGAELQNSARHAERGTEGRTFKRHDAREREGGTSRLVGPTPGSELRVDSLFSYHSEEVFGRIDVS